MQFYHGQCMSGGVVLLGVPYTGPGESGKSTVFKQMKIIYGVGFSDEDKALFVHVVHNNIISSMRTLIQACEDLGYETSCAVRGGRCRWRRGACCFVVIVCCVCCRQDDIDRFNDVPDECVIDADLGALIAALWADPGIQMAYTNRHRFQLNDSAP